jgi:hypothetical protein
MLHSGRVGSSRTDATEVVEVQRRPSRSTVLALTTAPSPAPAIAMRGLTSMRASRGAAEMVGWGTEPPHPEHASTSPTERTRTLRTKGFSTHLAAGSTARGLNDEGPLAGPFAHLV